MFMRAAPWLSVGLLWMFSLSPSMDRVIVPAVQAQIFPDISHPDVQFIFFAAALLEVGLEADALQIYEQELERLEQQGDRDRAIRLLIGIAAEFHNRGQLTKALVYYQRSFATEEVATTIYYDEVVDTQGAIYQALGQFDLALAIYQQALNQSQASRNPWAAARTFSNMGMVYQNSGQPEQALAAYQQAMSLYQQFDVNAPEAPKILNRIGLVYQQQGLLQEAIAAYQQALEMCHQVEPEFQIVQIANQVLTLENLSYLYQRQGQATKAQEYAAQVAQVLQVAATPDPLGIPYSMEMIWEEIGAFYLTANQLDRAQTYFDRAVAIARQSHNQDYAEIQLLGSIVLTCTKQGQFALALPYQQQSIDVFRRLDLSENTATALRTLANLYREMGQWDTALATYQEALKMYELAHQEFGSSATSIAHIFQQMGDVQETQGQFAIAATAYQQALAQYQQSRTPLGQIAVLERLANLHEKQGQIQQAQDYEQQAIVLRRQVGLNGSQGK